MTSNLQEFIGMASFVTAATMFVVGLRWAILKMGVAHQQQIKAEPKKLEA